MSGRGAGAIYFGAGSPDSPHGSLFKLWAIDGDIRPDGPSDFYLAERSRGNILKTSFHKSGKWRTAVTDTAVTAGKVALPPGADRKVSGWDRPAMHARGFVAAYKVGVPSSELRSGPLKLPRALVHWVADPGPGKAVQFIILLVGSQVRQVTLSDPDRISIACMTSFAFQTGKSSHS